MICESPTENQTVVNRVRDWHRDRESIRNRTPLDIDYGWYGKNNGAVRLSMGQFELTHVTRRTGNVVTWESVSYNHSFANTISLKSLEAALKCEDLARDVANRSLVILMTSECARSEVVQQFISAILSHVSMSQQDFAIIQELTKSYDKTLQMAGRSSAPDPDWQPLTFEDHRRYQSGAQDVKKLQWLNELYDKISTY